MEIVLKVLYLAKKISYGTKLMVWNEDSKRN